VIYENFLIVADEKKNVDDNDLVGLASSIPVLAK
jgi:hypothetical protein